MSNFANILTTIRRPFQQELRKGCRDDVVVNGLENYVQLWIKNGNAFTLNATEKEVLNSLATLFENYAGASPTERQHGSVRSKRQQNELISPLEVDSKIART